MQFGELCIICLHTFRVISFTAVVSVSSWWHKHSLTLFLLCPYLLLSHHIVLIYQNKIRAESCQRPLKSLIISFILSSWNLFCLSHIHSHFAFTIGYIWDQYGPQVFSQLHPLQWVCSNLVPGCIDFSFVRWPLFFSPLAENLYADQWQC